MDGSLLIFAVLLVGFLVLAMAALGAGVDSRDFDPQVPVGTLFTKGDGR